MGEGISLLQFVNCAAHAVAFVGVCVFNIMVFGRHDSRVYKWSWVSCTVLRIFLAATAIGHATCALSTHDITWQEAILNVGSAIMWPWVAWFHYNMFVVKKLD